MEQEITKLLFTLSDSKKIWSPEYQRSEFLNEIKNNRPDIYELCTQFLLAWDAWVFSKKDMQLHLKAPDLYQIQKKMFSDNLTEKANSLLNTVHQNKSEIIDILKNLDIETDEK